jgi:hypothetical protein
MERPPAAGPVVSAARRKGNALELLVAGRLRAIDGSDPNVAALETSGGRLGLAYSMQIDVATEHLAVECKNREDHPARLWEWLDRLTLATERLALRTTGSNGDAKTPVLVIKRNRRRPLVVLDLDDFEQLVTAARRRPARVDL